MKIESLLAAVLLACPLVGRAAEEPPAQPRRTPNEIAALAALNKSIDDLDAAWAGVHQCLAFEASLKADLAKKEAALAAEFNGKVPREFDELIWRRTERITKQHQACIQQHTDFDKQVVAVVQSFRGFELRNYRTKKQLDKVNALIAESKAMSTPNKPKPKK